MLAPPLNALRVFEVVARTESFRAAADELCVTQSAVSHQVRHLESWLGVPLFERHGNHTKLLAHGAELADALSRSLAEIDIACEHARNGSTDQPLVIAAIPSVALCWLIPRLNDFRKQFPSIETRMINAIHGRDVNFRETHIAFVFAQSPPEIPGVEVIKFLPGASVPVCSPQLLSNSGIDTHTPDDLLRLGLLHDTDLTGWQSWMDSVRIKSVNPLTGALFEDFNLLRAAALSGQGVALCASALVKSDLDAGRLMQLSDVSVLNNYTYYMLIGPLAQSSMMSEVRAFSEWVESCTVKNKGFDTLG